MPRLGLAEADARERVPGPGRLDLLIVGGLRQADRVPVPQRHPRQHGIAPHRRAQGPSVGRVDTLELP